MQIDRYENFAENLGLATMVLCMNGDRMRMPIAAIKIWIEPAILHKQIKFIFNKYSQLVGYFTWAKVSDAVLRELKDDPNRLLHISEWNEGGNYVIVDFLYDPEAKFLAFREIIKSFKCQDEVFWRSSKVKFSKRLM